MLSPTPYILGGLAVVMAAMPSPAQTARPELPQLEAPFVVEADGEPIACATGHAAPFVTDLDGDGVWDLAVGEFGGGRCRLYKNLGTATEPRFGAFAFLQADGQPAVMESS